MAYNNRPLSPGGKRIQNAGRTSDTRVSENTGEAYRGDRHNSYVSPRSSGVIPISTETYVSYPTAQTSRSDQQRYDSYSGRVIDAYSGRPRRSSTVDSQRGSSSATQLPIRSRPMVVQSDSARPASPLKGTHSKDSYVNPAVSKEPRKETHRKVYSVTNDGTASLVADVNLSGGGERHHKRRDSEGQERSGYRSTGTEKDRGRRGYHLNGPTRSNEKSIDDDDAFSYTDPAGMFRDTEPRWREREVRPRRGSVDRGGASSRERPVSMLDPAMDPRRPSREIGPPPSTRGWDKLNEGVSRARSTRERPRDVAQSPTRARGPISPTEARLPPSPTRGRYAGDPKDPYYVPPRTSSNDNRKYLTVNQGGHNGQFEYREPRRHERRNSMTRVPDHSVERRGFGIRSDSQDRYGRANRETQGRGSDESFNQQNQYRDSSYVTSEPHRRDTASDLSHHDLQRLEQEKRDRARAGSIRNDERDRPHDRESYDREPRRSYEDQRDSNRDYDRGQDQRRDREKDHDVDRERERERERMMQPQSQPERERNHHRHDSYRGDYDRREPGARDSGDSVAQPGLSSAAAGGLAGAAGAAATYGIGNYLSKNDDRGRERDRDRDRDRDQDYRQDKPREYDREKVSARPQELRPPQDQRPKETHSDEGAPYGQERDRDLAADNDRGLGFAFENPPEPPRSAPPVRNREDAAPPRDTVAERDFERTHEDAPQGDTSKPAIDPDEDYRRRMEQVQREMGRGSDERSSDSDPDRERRRREREQRLREREFRNGDASTVGANSSYTDTTASYQMPGSFENDNATARPLRRRRSILDEPMTGEPAQIIDNTQSEKRENRVRIVDPPLEEDNSRPKGILKRPTTKFPDYPDAVREGVAPLKDATKSGIPPGARWTKIDRRLVNPEALEEAKERFEERQDFVIVLRVLTKDEIQKLADRTKELRGKYRKPYCFVADEDPSFARGGFSTKLSTPDQSARPQYRRTSSDPPAPESEAGGRTRKGGKKLTRRAWTFHATSIIVDFLKYSLTESPQPTDERYEEERDERKPARRRERNHERRDRDEYEDENSEDEFKPRAPKMLEGPSTAGASAGEPADFVRDGKERRRERDGEREPQYMSGGLGRREEY